MRAACLALAATAALTACARVPAPALPGPDPAPPAIQGVRYVESTEFYGQDAKLHLFLFQPAAERPLGERIRAARAAIDDDPDCDWIGAPRSYLADKTAEQGPRYAQTMLVAPLRCG